MADKKLMKTHNLKIKIREKCLEKGITNAYQLQMRANLAPSVAQNLFNENFSEISLPTLEKLLEALNCEASDLFVKEPSDWQKARAILESARRVLVLTGAGVSAESNVPTFRGGGGAGVWRGMPFEELSSARMVAENLPLVWEWFDYRRDVLDDCHPNPAHRAIADWQLAGDFDEFTLVTQNIDGLHRAAGSTKILELHGNIWRAKCVICREIFDVRDLPPETRPPVCRVCGDNLRPNVVLFGENLSEQILETAFKKAKSCDVCLVVGTSSLVCPAASLPEIAQNAGAKIIEINPEETSLTGSADVSLRGKAGEILPHFSSVIIKNLNDADNYVSQTEAATIKGVSRQRIQQIVKSGRLKAVGEGHDARIKVEDLMSLPEGKKGRPRKTNKTQTETKEQVAQNPKNPEDDLSEIASIGNIKVISNSDLIESDIPTMIEDWETFALSFGMRDYSVLNAEAQEIYNRTGNLDDLSLDQLRGALLFIQRAQRWGFDYELSDVTREFIENILNAIRQKVKNKNTRNTKNSNSYLNDEGIFLEKEDEAILDEVWKEITLADEAKEENRFENLVLTFACEGGGVDIYRRKNQSGEWTFFSEGSDLDEDEELGVRSWTKESPTLGQIIKKNISDYHIFVMSPLYIHPEHRSDIQKYLEDLYTNLSDEEHTHLQQFAEHSAVMPDDWIKRGEQKMKKRFDSEKWKADDIDSNFLSNLTRNHFSKDERDLIKSCLRIEKNKNFIVINVEVVDYWESAHQPILKWVLAGKFAANSDQARINEQIRKILDNKKYFDICADCRIPVQKGWLIDKYCSSCAWQNHGIIS